MKVGVAKINSSFYNNPANILSLTYSECVFTKCFNGHLNINSDQDIKLICTNPGCRNKKLMHASCFYMWQDSIINLIYNNINGIQSKEYILHNLWFTNMYNLNINICQCKCLMGYLRKDVSNLKLLTHPGIPTSVFKEFADGKKFRHSQSNGKDGNNCIALTTNFSPMNSSFPTLFDRNSSNLPQGNYNDLLCSVGDITATVVKNNAWRNHNNTSRNAANIYYQNGSSIGHLKSPFTDEDEGCLPKCNSMSSSAPSDKTNPNFSTQLLPTCIFPSRKDEFEHFNMSLPRSLINSFHIKMDDDGPHGNDEIRYLILSKLSAKNFTKIPCIFCGVILQVYDRYPLINGLLFLSVQNYYPLFLDNGNKNNMLTNRLSDYSLDSAIDSNLSNKNSKLQNSGNNSWLNERNVCNNEPPSKYTFCLKIPLSTSQNGNKDSSHGFTSNNCTLMNNNGNNQKRVFEKDVFNTASSPFFACSPSFTPSEYNKILYQDGHNLNNNNQTHFTFNNRNYLNNGSFGQSTQQQTISSPSLHVTSYNSNNNSKYLNAVCVDCCTGARWFEAIQLEYALLLTLYKELTTKPANSEQTLRFLDELFGFNHSETGPSDDDDIGAKRDLIHLIQCKKCQKPWNGSRYTIGTVYQYDIVDANFACQCMANSDPFTTGRQSPMVPCRICGSSIKLSNQLVSQCFNYIYPNHNAYNNNHWGSYNDEFVVRNKYDASQAVNNNYPCFDFSSSDIPLRCTNCNYLDHYPKNLIVRNNINNQGFSNFHESASNTFSGRSRSFRRNNLRDNMSVVKIPIPHNIVQLVGF